MAYHGKHCDREVGEISDSDFIPAEPLGAVPGPRETSVWKVIPNTCMVKVTDSKVMVVYGSRSDPSIDIHDSDEMSRGYYRINNGFVEPIDWRDFYRMNWKPPCKVQRIA